jgi:hypothetical protein
MREPQVFVRASLATTLCVPAPSSASATTSHAQPVSILMLSLLTDGLGTIAGILLGIAIPAQQALRVHRMIDGVVGQRTRETRDALDALQMLAEQAVQALPENPARVCNRSQIEHALKRMEATALGEPACAADFVSAAAHARASARAFFDAVFSARERIDGAKSSPQSLRRLFNEFTDDIGIVDAAHDRLVKSR